jgi:hypothetical protein
MVSWPALAGPSLPETGGEAGQPGRPLDPDGAHLHPDHPRRRGQEAIGPGGSLFGGGSVGQHRDDDRGAADGLRRAGRHDRAVGRQGRRPAAGTVPYPHVDATAGQVGGHRAAHPPGAEESDDRRRRPSS